MAGRNTKTIFEYSGERNEERSEEYLEKNQTSTNNLSNEGTKKTFTVQNYRDYMCIQMLKMFLI